VRLLEIE
jgi:hypothetical protein